MSIIAFGVICLLCAAELAAGGPLARALCVFIAVFWAVRLSLQPVLDVGPHLTAWWLRLGYHLLTVLFVSFALLFAYAAVR